MPRKSAERFERSLAQKAQIARTAVERCLKVCASAAKEDARQTSADEAGDAVTAVIDLLDEQDRPAWLTGMHKHFERIRKSHASDQAADLLVRVNSDLYPRMCAHDWTVDDGDQMDFDAIYNEFRNELGIPELFDKLIGQLQEIVSSDEAAQSLTQAQITELENLVANLRTARNGSLFAARGAAAAATTIFKNFGWEAIQTVPILKNVANAAKKTCEDLNINVNEAARKTIAKWREKFPKSFPMLEKKSPDAGSEIISDMLLLEDQSETES